MSLLSSLVRRSLAPLRTVASAQARSNINALPCTVHIVRWASANRLSPEVEWEKRKRAALYRSKQRGWLEMDLFLGSWATQNIEHLTVNQLTHYEHILSEENPDLWNWVLGIKPVPERLDNEVMKSLVAFAQNTKLDFKDGNQNLPSQMTS